MYVKIIHLCVYQRNNEYKILLNGSLFFDTIFRLLLLGSSLAFVLYRINVVQKLNEIDNKPVERKYKWLGYFDQYKDNPVVKIIGWITVKILLFYTTHLSFYIAFLNYTNS